MKLQRNLERLRSAGVKPDISTINALTPLFQTISETILLLEETKRSAEGKVGISTLKVLFSDLLGLTLEANSHGFKDKNAVKDIDKKIHIIAVLADLTDKHP